ncbi:MAG TPA: MFS transporter, partial [Dehalococcoidia bacterium]|nr:MFS transporter [Dehalococcoidia bacterium]
SLPAASNYRWLVMGLWLLSSVSGFMVIYTLGILLPVISDDLNLSPAEQGLLGSASHWGNIALAIPLTLWTSRFGAKRLTTVTLVLATACLFIQGWAPVFAVLLFGRLAFGITIIAQQPARAFLTQQWFQTREIIIVNGLSNVLFGLVVGGGLLASPFILSAFGNDWRSTFRAYGVLFGALTLLWLLLGKERTGTGRQKSEDSGETGILRGGLARRDLWLCGFGFLGATMAFSAFVSFYPTLMLENHQVSLRWSGAILALGVLVGGLGGLGVGMAAARKSMEKHFLVILGTLMAGTYVGMLFTGSIPVLMVISFFNGFSWAFFPILITVPFLLPGIRPREMAVALSFTIMVTSLGTSLGPLITGFIQEATGDLRLSLLIISFPPLSLFVSGMTIRFNQGARQSARAPSNPSHAC